MQSAIRHHVFGGFWFAACLFVLWTQGIRPDGEKVRRRVLTILIGSTVAALLSLLIGELFFWLPPSRNPMLAHYYPSYISENVNDSSFPSQSTALYAAVAAGVFSLNRVAGSALWIAVPLLVGLPRMYVGGHYPTDVVVGLLLGLLAYFFTRTFLEPRLDPSIGGVFERSAGRRVLGEFLVFVWILQIAVEFREFAWIKGIIEFIVR